MDMLNVGISQFQNHDYDLVTSFICFSEKAGEHEMGHFITIQSIQYLLQGLKYYNRMIFRTTEYFIPLMLC